MDRKIISAQSLEKLLGYLLSTFTVVAPKKKGNRIEFERVHSFTDITFDYIATNQSPKQVVFPRSETVMKYTVSKENIDVSEVNPEVSRKTLVFGARPCDSAGLVSLEAIFTWDTRDAMFMSRRENTTIIGLACTTSDEYCFCTSVAGGPGNTLGSDILLTPIEDGAFLAEIISDKGKIIVDSVPGLFEPDNGAEKNNYLAEVKVAGEFHKLSSILPEKFNDSGFWMNQSLRCIGCGACAYVCPACACFDIQDESRGKTGRRLKCWDSCGFRMFTLHTSGHNPREVQSERWRQRIMHKFSYMPQQQEVYGCVGCGRCSRVCPVDMNISEHLRDIASQSQSN